MITYQQFVAKRKAIEERMNRHASMMDSIKGHHHGPMGLTPDYIRAIPAWQLAKKHFGQAFSELRALNMAYSKKFRKEEAAARTAELEERNKRWIAGDRGEKPLKKLPVKFPPAKVTAPKAVRSPAFDKITDRLIRMGFTITVKSISSLLWVVTVSREVLHTHSITVDRVSKIPEAILSCAKVALDRQRDAKKWRRRNILNHREETGRRRVNPASTIRPSYPRQARPARLMSVKQAVEAGHAFMVVNPLYGREQFEDAAVIATFKSAAGANNLASKLKTPHGPHYIAMRVERTPSGGTFLIQLHPKKPRARS